MTEDRFPVDPHDAQQPRDDDPPPPPPAAVSRRSSTPPRDWPASPDSMARPDHWSASSRDWPASAGSPAPSDHWSAPHRSPAPAWPPPPPPGAGWPPPGPGGTWAASGAPPAAAPPAPPRTPRPWTGPRPSALDATLLPLWILLGQVLAGIAILPGLLLTDDPETTGRVLIAVSAVLGWLAVVVGTALWLHVRGAWQRAWLTGHRPRSGWLAGLIGVAGAVGGFILVQVVVGLFTWVTGAEPPEQEIFELLDDPMIGWALGLIAVLVAPVVEEVVFRGVMLDVMARRWSWWVAAVAQAAVFSAIHIETLLSPPMFLALGLLGLAFAWLRRVTGSLIAPVMAHLAFNGISVGLAMLAPESPTAALLRF